MPDDKERPQAAGDDDRPPDEATDKRAPEADETDDGRLAAEHGKPPPRAISDGELKNILAAHKAWLESDGENGQRANLEKANLKGTDLRDANLQRAWLLGANLEEADLCDANLQRASLRFANFKGASLLDARLQGADLRDARLQEADLRRANLQGADLFDANLQGADLRDAKLQEANLRLANLCGANLQEADLADVNLNEAGLLGTTLRNANLTDATLTDVRGLQSGQLGGADLSNAKLPEDIARFEGLAHVTEISKHARNVFLAVIGGCVFSWLTIATTTDVALLTNSGSSPLPIIQTKVPIAGFYWAAPAILLALYSYLHLYLQRLWEGMASLPAIFPDGRTLDERAYPWLLSGIVRAHVPRLKDKPQARLGLQVAVSIVTAWMFVPGTLGLFWLRYLPLHDWLPTLWLVALFVVAVAFGTSSYRLATTTLRGEPTTKPDAKSEEKAATPTWKRALRVVRGYRPDGYSVTAAALGVLISLGAIQGRPGDWTKDVRHWVYSLAEIAGYYPALEMVGEDVSIKPDDWSGLGKEPNEVTRADLAEIKGARLRGRDLKYARAFGVFLVKTDLFHANLQGADFTSANLQEADLRGAHLEKAFLKDANLQGANLSSAILRKASLYSANLQGATLNGADLSYASLYRANLQEANLRNVDLRKANLGDANLQEADLRGADLRGTRFVGANLSNAKLQGVDLGSAKCLTQDQIESAFTDETTTLPIEFPTDCPDE